MTVSSLYNVNFSDPVAMLQFSYNNQTHHINVQDAIYKKFTVNLPLYPIDPIPEFDFVTWLQTHQSMHSDVNGILNVQGQDISAVDPTKPEDVEVWSYQHAQEHYRWSVILGVP